MTTAWVLLPLLDGQTDAGWTVDLGCAGGEVGAASDCLVFIRRSDHLRPEPSDQIEVRAIVVVDVEMLGIRLQTAYCRIRAQMPWQILDALILT